MLHPYINKGSKTYIKEVKINLYKETNAFDEFPLYQIDISYSYNLIFNKKRLLGNK